MNEIAAGNERTGQAVKLLKLFCSALNAGKAEDAIKLFAEDAVYSVTTAPDATTLIFKGKKIGHYIRTRIKENAHVRIRDRHTKANQTHFTTLVSTDPWRQTGLAPIEEAVQILVENGKLKAVTTEWTLETQERIRVGNLYAGVGVGS